jgi:hypothetical protein
MIHHFYRLDIGLGGSANRPAGEHLRVLIARTGAAESFACLQLL